MEYNIEGTYVGRDGKERTIDSWFKPEEQRTYHAEPVLSKAQQRDFRRMVAPNWMQALYSIGF
jgi:hypothetical protein